MKHIALIGFGEVGRTLAGDFAGKATLSAWDIALTPNAPGVRAAASATDAVQGADLIISAVTADQDLAAARSVGPLSGAFFLDLNSCSPGQKIASADAIHAVGGRYVEAAVMSPIGPKRIASPMLLGGLHARDFLLAAEGLGFTGATAYSEIVGQAAATKLCRSVMIKGIEALLTESMLAARHYGVERVVLDSLSDLLPLPDWPKTAQYMISRSLEHGARRAEEMREAANTVLEAGFQPIMTTAIADKQQWVADHAREGLFASLAKDANWKEFADALLAGGRKAP